MINKLFIFELLRVEPSFQDLNAVLDDVVKLYLYRLWDLQPEIVFEVVDSLRNDIFNSLYESFFG